MAEPFCHRVEIHRICIHTIKRSAKHYWEYRAIASIDGVRQPLSVYDCRRQVKVNEKGQSTPFEPSGPGPLICRLVNR